MYLLVKNFLQAFAQNLCNYPMRKFFHYSTLQVNRLLCKVVIPHVKFYPQQSMNFPDSIYGIFILKTPSYVGELGRVPTALRAWKASTNHGSHCCVRWICNLTFNKGHSTRHFYHGKNG